MGRQQHRQQRGIVSLEAALFFVVVVVVVVVVTVNVSQRPLRAPRVQSRVTSQPSSAEVSAPPTPHLTFSTPHLMTTYREGRLGNAMFQYAALLALSRYHGYTAVLHEEYFPAPVFDLQDISILVQFENQDEAKLCPFGVYCSHYLNLSHDRNWTLVGYFQSWRYFRNESELIRRNFRFTRKIRAAVSTTLASLNFSDKVKVGVHVRRGDYLLKYNADVGYVTASVGYLRRAMNYFRSKFKEVVFLVASDDLEWCEANIPDRNDTFMVRGSSGHDLAVLAGCDHSIITSGTFGWWGAWLAGGQTVFFKKYPLPGSRLAKQFNPRDYYPPDWIPMW